MKNPVPIELNAQNLIDISKVLKEIEHFIFFGTLLGITRDGEIIPNDDDIDIYVDINLRKDLIIALKKYGYEINEKIYPNFTQHMLQLQVNREGIKTLIDFYFFDSSNKNYIIEKWNFSGYINNIYENMRIPKDLIFPLQKYLYRDIEISIPAKPQQTCIFLYGKDWDVPLKKRVEYFHIMIFQRPIVLKGFCGKIIKKIVKETQSFKLKIRLLLFN